MSSMAVETAKSHFFELLPAEFDVVMKDRGFARFRSDQVRDWVYRKFECNPDRMTNLGKLDRQRLVDAVSFITTDSVVSQESTDGTRKLLLGWPAGANAETVLIPDGDRRTACVSSQVGCPVGCTFCASGVNGVKGNLSAGQIVEQVFALNQLLGRAGERVNHVVFMGMGEPLANYSAVLKAIRILNHADCFNISARKITISTVGVPPKMRELAREDLALNLAISLHAPNEKLRRQLIPWAEHFSIDEILDAARDYFQQTGREITLEYILLAGVNDRPEHAAELARVARTLRANINLIRYNEVEGLPFKRPASDAVVAFQSILRNAGLNTHVRKSRGRDIDAACGQLRRRQEAGIVTLGGGAR